MQQSSNKVLTTRGGFLRQTFREKGLRGLVRKIGSALQVGLPLFLLGRRTTKSVGAYFDLITDDARLFYGDSFHFGYFPGDQKTLQEGLDAHTDLVAEMARLANARTVLDIGCGIGAPAIRIAKKYPNLQITGVNISREQVEQGKKFVAEHGLSHKITIKEGNALALDWKENSADAILCLEVAGDICVANEQKKKLIGEMFRVLKPAGTLGFSDLVFKSSPTAEEEKIMRAILYHEGKELITDWASLFRAQGFEVLEEKEILSETMPTWDHSIAVYENQSKQVEERYGKRIAASTLQHLRKIPDILARHAAFVILSLRKPHS